MKDKVIVAALVVAVAVGVFMIIVPGVNFFGDADEGEDVTGMIVWACMNWLAAALLFSSVFLYKKYLYLWSGISLIVGAVVMFVAWFWAPILTLPLSLLFVVGAVLIIRKKEVHIE